MGVDGGDYSLRGKRSVGFGGDVCRAGFLCETARGDFRFGDSIENGTRQGRAPLRAVARTRAPAERPVSLDKYLPIGSSHSAMERLGTATCPAQPRGSGRALREAAEIQW